MLEGGKQGGQCADDSGAARHLASMLKTTNPWAPAGYAVPDFRGEVVEEALTRHDTSENINPNRGD